MRIQALDYPEGGTHDEHTAYRNSLGRYIAVKEQHAELVKHEVDVLWHDYFKPEHLEKYPDLHNSVWETTKLASTNKQTVDLDAAKSLVASVDKIAETFWATNGRDLRGRGRPSPVRHVDSRHPAANALANKLLALVGAACTPTLIRCRRNVAERLLVFLPRR